MLRGFVVVSLAAAACGNTTQGSSSHEPPGGSAPPSATAPPAPDAPPAPPPACSPDAPAAACKQRPGVRICKPGDRDRIGEWRYAIEVPLFSRVEDLTAAELAAAWKGEGGITLRATPETSAALASVLGPGKVEERAGRAPDEPASGPEIPIDDTHFAIVPADALVPNWKAITVDGKHPLDNAATPLAVPLCGPAGKTDVRNIDPAKLTTVIMTGTTALTRYTAQLMNDKGVLYPLSAVEPWLASADFVHFSNEVSFVPRCDAGSKPTMSFCSKDSYIELLEKSHASIIELTGSHLVDYGREWLDRTIDMYQERGWKWFGGGRTQIEATAPMFLDHAGNKLAFLGCNKPWTEWKTVVNGAGVAACDLDRMTWQIRDLRKRGYTVIVSVQHDEVYVHDPPHGLVHDLRRLAEAGPAFVMGSQAHCAHPWEVHHGAYVHYGPGNFYFDQFWHPVRDGAHDKLYIHAGKLLAVAHLYTRIEERGRPRILTARERTEFLADLDRARARLPRGIEPWALPVEVPASRERPDSVLIKRVGYPLVVTAPAKLEPGQRYPLVVELGGPAVVADAGFVVRPGKSKVNVSTDQLGAAIRTFMIEKYPIDEARVTLNTPPKKSKKKK